ncbi:uncharacterized protein LOC131657947 [Vicia villosa]|uniref:uncharacterized protein LOC131657947 n=1 Tax=Vicia villosa TaxID=3911 RepID=UPI00273B8723|nr:uncharacterized protein LOC131657947 [Vicia villosa]
MVQRIAWSPPKRGWIKLNVDEACKNSGNSGCGGVARNDKGEMIFDFAKWLRSCNAFMAELWSLYEGVKLLHSRGILKMEVNVDSTTVLKAIERKCFSMIESLSIINRICSLLDNLEEMLISHSYREANKCANVLASVGCGIGHDMILFYIAPDCIVRLIQEDAKGATSTRLVTV